jgi:hypothetical protein
MFQIDLKTQVPMYNKSKPNYGGPACCQMAMDGYPPGATPCHINQNTIWNYIQANNKEGGVGPWGIGWYADPYAVTKVLNDLCPPQHSWVDVSGTDRDTVLYTLFRWMANYKYASLVCVFAHDYWDALVYYRTSDDPRTVTNPTLEYIGWYEPGDFGTQYKQVSGSLWKTSPAYWGQPCPSGQIWKGKWVGIGEPPEVEGSVHIESVPRVGKELISPEDAVRAAQKFIAQQLQEKSDFFMRCLIDVQPAQPMLVRELPIMREREVTAEHEEPSREECVRYYVVPFTQRWEIDRSGERLARLSVLVNGYTGRFEELCVFPQPVRYLSEREVHWIAIRNLGLSKREVRRMEAELVFQPLPPHVSSALPAWQVQVADRKLFVTQAGLVFGTLHYPTYRGA